MTTNSILPSMFLKTVLKSGVGRHVCQLQRVTFKFCKAHGGSRGVREFIECDLLDFTRRNPGIVVYLLPRRNRAPVLVGEYLNGHRETVLLSQVDREDTAKYLELLRTQSGRPEIRIIKYWHTDTPSIQGVWNPFTRIPTHIHSANLPNAYRSNYRDYMPSATEQIIHMAKD